MARVELRFGNETWTVTHQSQQLVQLHLAPARRVSKSPAELVADALEHPFGFESMRRAVTPEDQIVIVVDHSLPELPAMIDAIVSHLATASVPKRAITLLSPPGSAELELEGIRQEIHDPEDRKKMAYLATTSKGQRVYLNRTLVEADFTILLSSRRYDLATGYAGAEAMIFPHFSDTETLEGYLPEFLPEKFPHASQRKELVEIAWLLGTPFLIHVIEGRDGVAAVAAGLLDSSVEGMRLQDEHWKASVTNEADLVIACINSAPDRTRFSDLAFAAAVAQRVVSSNGRIVILFQANKSFRAARRLAKYDDAATALAKLPIERETLLSRVWAWVASQSRMVITSNETEELFALGTDDVKDVQRLIDAAERLIIIPDAHRLLVGVQPTTP